MKTIMIISLAFLLVSFSKKAKNPSKFLPLMFLIKDGTLIADLVSRGGHMEDCMNLKLRNNSDDTVYTVIEPGTRLIADDSGEQDILVVKEKQIMLMPYAVSDETLFGFCAEASDKSPSLDSRFTIGGIDTTLRDLASLINRKRVSSVPAQHAIWCLTDNLPVASVFSEYGNTDDSLVKFVASARKEKLPWYGLTYLPDTTRLFSNRPYKLFGSIDYRVSSNVVITIIIRSHAGREVACLARERPAGPGLYTCELGLDVSRWQKGKYDILIYQDHTILNNWRSFEI